MKSIILLTLLVFNVSYADYLVRIPIETWMPENSIVFQGEGESNTAPENDVEGRTSYKVVVEYNRDVGFDSVATDPDFVVLMPANWIDNSFYLMIGSNKFSSISNAYFRTQDSGLYKLDIGYGHGDPESWSDPENNLYRFSLTSNDPAAPMFDMILGASTYYIEFYVDK